MDGHIYISDDHKARSMASVEDALKHLFLDEEDHRTLVVYIHGRGLGKEDIEREPHKSAAHVIPFLESQYNVRVMMFHWGGIQQVVQHPIASQFPEAQARKASHEFGQMLQQLYESKTNAVRKCVLFTHSMGSVVLEQYLLDNAKPELGEKLFNNVLITSSASSVKNHSEWLGHLNFAEKIYVTVNSHDPILTIPGPFKLKKRLGKKLESKKSNFTLTPNVDYFDVSNTGVKHRYFLHGGQDGNSSLRFFFDTVFHGDNVPWSDEEHFDGLVVDRDGASVHKAKSTPKSNQ